MLVVSEDKIVPKLRFEGFDGEWNESKLENLFNFSVAGNLKEEIFNDIKDTNLNTLYL